MEHLVRPLLSQDEIDSIHQHLSTADLPWRDGRLTAGEQAASVKKNLQLDPESPLAIQIVNKVSEALKADPLIRSFALIRKVHSVLISRCGPGDGYGWHVDNPFSRYGRRDLSFTVFLSDASTIKAVRCNYRPARMVRIFVVRRVRWLFIQALYCIVCPQ